ncbi:MAG: hypothetical protein RL141_1080 [Candidatus Parcubacteria bacterium]|jgi:type IV pilus assembly protein PilC
MPSYSYKATDRNGTPVEGILQATTETEVFAALSAKKLFPITITLAQQEGDRARWRLSSTPFSMGMSALDKILLIRHLSVILKAGIGLNEALDIVLQDTQKTTTKNILKEAKASVEMGEPFFRVFERHPRTFSPVFVGLIRAGETSGTLEQTLDNLMSQLLRDYNLLKSVRLAMVYPLILLLGSAGVILLMMTFVLPRMSRAFAGVLGELPLITQVFIRLSEVLGRNPLLTAITSVLLIGTLLITARTARGKRLLFLVFHRLPILRDLIQKMALARFSRTFQNLLASGVGVMDAIDISATTIGNPQFMDALMRMKEDLKKGMALSDAFRNRPKLFPSMFSSMITIGERTGSLNTSLGTLSAFYDEEMDRLLKTLVALMEPLLLLIMGLVVSGVALAVLLPMFRLVRIFQGG